MDSGYWRPSSVLGVRQKEHRRRILSSREFLGNPAHAFRCDVEAAGLSWIEDEAVARRDAPQEHISLDRQAVRRSLGKFAYAFDSGEAGYHLRTLLVEQEGLESAAIRLYRADARDSEIGFGEQMKEVGHGDLPGSGSFQCAFEIIPGMEIRHFSIPGQMRPETRRGLRLRR